MKNKGLFSLFVLLLALNSCVLKTEDKADVTSSEELETTITRFDRPDASILKGVHIPSDKEYFYTSGLVADVINPNVEAGTYERYGNTYQQSISTLEKIKATLKEADFEMKDVFFLRVYLAPNQEGEVDWQAWFDAYGEYFNNDENPNKVARSTIAVYALANPDLLIEIEAVAAK
ncbi:putative translation initiation inhibitor, yjgF family [Belliella baltica DSM 15883]|uniref:Putative translation initiation inhibitor, yjgF family n=1 Tax=Belliella baltica (strain DSM 15883 / CIP 108006 / LMG 21964 / BA134) TaxID=866536 RepID=I3Z4K4_BELBD|nr:RidA family protein [Belliella baltica]AFL84172.1 putative translation initiation inhibitor, yjgF family [Belliella baltica DSM 15883]